MDISDVCIAQMARANADRPQMTWEVGDVSALSHEEESFECVIDKATADAVICMPDGLELVKKMFHEAYRVLKPKGVFIVVSVQANVKELLEEVKLPWSIGKLDVKTQLVNGSHSQAQDHVTVICCRKKKLAGFTKAQGLMARLLIAAKKKELLEAAEKGDGAAAVEALVEKAKEAKDGEAPGAAE